MGCSGCAKLAVRDVKLKPKLQRCQETLNSHFHNDYAGQEDVVIALVELFAAADEQGQPDISRLAERIVWHKTGDVEILYPAVILVSSGIEADMDEASPSESAGSSEGAIRQ